jgi:beta-glucanase (GH16 family)
MTNVLFDRHALRKLSYAGIATILLASCGGGGASGEMAAQDEYLKTSNANANANAQPTAQTSETQTTTTTTTEPTATPPAPVTPSTPTTPSTPAASAPVPFGQDASRYAMSFSDEFNNNGLNPNVWTDTVWYEASNPTKNYTVENGALKIWPQRDASGRFFNRTVDTDGKYYQTYGYFEIEAKLPIGKGVWPAFWLFNHIGARRPEIDIMEAYPGGGPNSGWGDANLHPIAYAPTVWRDQTDLAGTKTVVTPDLSAAFHKYALKWEPNKQTFYLDGKEVYTLNVTMGDPMYIMLDLWYGSASGQPDNSTPQGKGNSYEVNYVRAWRFK